MNEKRRNNMELLQLYDNVSVVSFIKIGSDDWDMNKMMDDNRAKSDLVKRSLRTISLVRKPTGRFKHRW